MFLPYADGSISSDTLATYNLRTQHYSNMHKHTQTQQGSIWKRAGWNSLDELRAKLEDLKELRDLVRSLGRGGGWGPLRRAPVQHLDMGGRPGVCLLVFVVCVRVCQLLHKLTFASEWITSFRSVVLLLVSDSNFCHPSIHAGLLRTVLEAQETRGLTRSDDISRMLPAEAAHLSRGRTVSVND